MPLGPEHQGSRRRLHAAPLGRSRMAACRTRSAESFYRKSLEKYEQAYRLRFGPLPGHQ